MAKAKAPQSASAAGPKIWLQDSQTSRVTHVAADSSAQNKGAAQSLAAGQAQPLSMINGDFDSDGVEDLAVGYAAGGAGVIAIHRGNLDAFVPQSDASFLAIGRGEFPAPFLSQARVFSVPIIPDFMALGRFTPGGHQDLVVAALGGSSLYLFHGDGKGSFGAPQTISLSGEVTALAAENLLRSLPYSNLVVGVATPQSSSLLVFSGSDAGMAPPAVFPLKAAATNIVFGDFGDSQTDTAFLSGGNVFVLHSSNFQMEALSLPVDASAMALGSFIFDRDPALQIALLTSDGTLHIAAHAEFDPRPLTVDEFRARLQGGRRGYGNPVDSPRALPQNGFKIVESIASAAPFAAGQPPVLFRTRISDHAADDVMVLNPLMGQFAVISHPDVVAGATTFLPAQISTRPYFGTPVSALPMRTNIDGRPGVVALHVGQLAPAVMMPLPDPTFTVNRTDDPVPVSPIANACNGVANDCSLREAILRANVTAGTDTVMVPAGIYTLSLARISNDCTGNHGALSVNDSLNIVGAGQATTIIQAGSTNATGVDMVMNVNEDLGTASCPLTNATASISNLTLQFGHNRGSVANFDGDGGCMEFDTGSSGNANLVLDHVTFTNCSTTDGNGGGIAIFNASSGPTGGAGLATITNSIFQNNSVAEVNTNAAGSGGAIWVADLARMSLSNSQVTNNNANQINGTGRGVGGGIFIFSAGAGSRQTVLHSNTITGNNASGDGGGIWSTSNLLVNNGGTPTSLTIISGNTAGGNGGGIHYHAVSPDVMTLSKVTITGNTATGAGGGIDAGEPTLAHAFSMSFSRLAANNAATAENLNNNHSTATVTNNWWGTNTPATTIVNTNSGTTTFDPFIVLTHTANPNKIRINQSSTLTGDMSADNHGNALGLSNLTEIIGLPITFNNPNLGTIPQAQPETLDANAQATATYNAGSVGGAGHADAVVDQATVTANIIVLQPPSITKSFSPTTVAVNAASTVTFSVTNANTVAINGNFTDNLPANLVVASTPSVVNGCGGSVTATAGAGSISFSNAASLAVGTCTITVNVQSAVDNTYTNSVTIDSTDAGNGNTASANLTVINPPTIAKAFGAVTIPLNGTTSLTFTLTSTNANLTLNGIAFTDNLPAGLVVATPSNLNSTCGGTATALGGSSTISLSGTNLPPGASCTISVNAQGATGGVKNNSVQVTSTNGGTGNTSNASVTVVAPPTVSKAFNPTSVALNAASTLSFTITNPNTASALSGVALADNLPAGVVVSATPSVTGSCGSGTITATAGSGTISISGGTLTASPAAGSSCTFSVSVTGTAAGAKNNTTGAITSTEGGTGTTSNTASLTVVAPPSIAKTFNPSTIALNATTSLTFTITNPAANTVALTGVAFTDTLPTGLTVANASATVCGGTLTTTAPTGITLSGATIAVNSQCQFSITVTGAASGQYTNTSGAVTSTNGGTGNTASANLTVATPPAINKSFSPTTIALNAGSTLSFTIQNPNTNVALSGVAFTDNLPAGLVVAAVPNITGSCGSGTITATAGSGAISLSGGTLTASPTAGSSCTFTANVTGTTTGIKNNSVQVTSTEAGTGNTSNASITVTAPPTISKAFNPTSVALNGSSTLSFTISNPNTASALSAVAFTDNLPAGAVVAATPNVTGSCGSGTITAAAGSGAISLSGGTLTASPAAGSSCTFSVSVTGTTAGSKSNTTGAVTSTGGGTGTTSNTAVLTVIAPPSIAKAFNPTTIALNGTTILTFTLTNPAANTVAEAGVAFTDPLPTGLVVSTPNGLSNTCNGTAMAVAGSTSISLTGGSIAVNASCTVTVNVTGTASGQYTNTSGAVTSASGGTGNTATANLTVASPPTITKVFGAIAIPLNGTTSLTFTIQNPNTALALTGIAFTDNLPAGLAVATPSGLTNTCGGTATAVAGSGSVSLSGGTLAGSASCTMLVNVTGIIGGVKNNSVTVTATESGSGNTSSNAIITVTSPPVISKLFGAASIPLNGSTSLTFTINNPNASTTLSGIGFSDTLPGGLVVSIPNALTGSCGGGAITATQATNVVSLSGATLIAGASCTFSVNVTGTAAGTQNNKTGNVTSTQGGTGGTASASIAVVAPPSIAKAFAPTVIAPGGTSVLSITITNPSANAVALTGVAFTDTLPAGLVVSTPNGLTGSCGGGTITAGAGSGGVSLSGGTVAASSSCTFSVNVTSSTPGSYTNTTGAVSSTNGGTGSTASANLSVGTPPSISKSFGAASVGLANSTSLTFTITNGNAATALTGVAFADALPAGLVVSTPNGLIGTCGSGTITAGSSTVSLTGGTIAAGSSCTFSIKVTATTAGNQVNTTGAVSSTNSGTGNTATASINVLAPDLTITKTHTGNFFQGMTGATFTISVNNVGQGSTAGTVTVTDTLPTGLTATAMAGTGWTCTLGSLTCTRNDALASGASYPAITLTVSIAANAPASVTNSVAVSGGGELNTANDTSADGATITTPPDFTLAVAPNIITVKAGRLAAYGIAVTPINNTFTSPIAFTATGLPGRTSLVFSPASVTPGANPATSALDILTTQGDPFLAQNTGRDPLPLYALFLPLTGLAFSGLGFRKGKLGRKWILAVAILVCSAFTFYGCASARNLQNLGTPPGTYTITVTATSGALQHSAPVTLIVQP